MDDLIISQDYRIKKLEEYMSIPATQVCITPMYL